MTIQRGVRCPNCFENIYSNSKADAVKCSCGAVWVIGGPDATKAGGTMRGQPVSRIFPRNAPTTFREERPVRAR